MDDIRSAASIARWLDKNAAGDWYAQVDVDRLVLNLDAENRAKWIDEISARLLLAEARKATVQAVMQ